MKNNVVCRPGGLGESKVRRLECGALGMKVEGRRVAIYRTDRSGGILHLDRRELRALVLLAQAEEACEHDPQASPPPRRCRKCGARMD